MPDFGLVGHGLLAMVGGQPTATAFWGTLVLAATVAVTAGACARRDPQPTATVQPKDSLASCVQITAEIQANNIRV